MMRLNSEKWRSLVDKIDKEKSGGEFWKEVNRMLGRRSRTTVVVLKDENGKKTKNRRGGGDGL